MADALENDVTQSINISNEEIKQDATFNIDGIEQDENPTSSPTKSKPGELKLKDIYDKSSLPLEVGLRFSVKEITFINTAEQRYGIKGDLKFSWKSTATDLSNFAAALSNYCPQFTPILMFINDIETNQYELEPITIKKGYNTQKLSFNMTFTEEFEVANFPFDVQDLSIVFQQTIETKQIRHSPSQLWSKYIKLNKTWCSITNWDILNVDASIAELKSMSKNKNDSNKDEFYEFVTFRIQVRRKWKGIVQRLMLWLLFLGIMAWSTFAVPASNIGDRLSYAITMALTIVAFQFVISSELPQVNYMTLLDKYNLFTFSFVLLITIESTMVGYNEMGLFNDAEAVDNYFAAICAVLFIVGNVLFVIYAYHVNKDELGKINVWQPYTPNIMYVGNEKGIYRNAVVQKEA